MIYFRLSGKMEIGKPGLSFFLTGVYDTAHQAFDTAQKLVYSF